MIIKLFKIIKKISIIKINKSIIRLKELNIKINQKFTANEIKKIYKITGRHRQYLQ